MRQVIVAFERQSNCDRLREIIEKSGEFSCIVCRTADQVRRAALPENRARGTLPLGEARRSGGWWSGPRRC